MRPQLALVYTRPWYRFELEGPRLTRATYEGLSERAQRLLRQVTLRDEETPERGPRPAEGGPAPT
jgi:hypothetical protein